MDKEGNKTGGRVKGTPNKKTSELQEIAEELGVNPFEILLHFAVGNYGALNLPEWTSRMTKSGEAVHEPTISPELRQKSAKDACEYLFPKLKSIEHKGKDGLGLFADILGNIDGSKRPTDSEA